MVPERLSFHPIVHLINILVMQYQSEWTDEWMDRHSPFQWYPGHVVMTIRLAVLQFVEGTQIDKCYSLHNIVYLNDTGIYL